MPGRGLPRSLGTTISTTLPRVISTIPNRRPTRSNHRSRHFPGAAPSSLLRGEFPQAPWDCANPAPNVAPAAGLARAAARAARPCALAEYGALTFLGSWASVQRNMLRSRPQPAAVARPLIFLQRRRPADNGHDTINLRLNNTSTKSKFDLELQFAGRNRC